MAPCPAGENDVALAPGYAANVEVATATPKPVELPEALDAPEVFDTPGATTIDAVAKLAGVPAGALIKAFPIIVGDDELRLVLVRGDHRVNEIKLGNTLGAAVPAGARRPSSRTGSARRATSARSGSTCRSCSTPRSTATPTSPAPTRPDAHLRGVQPGRDFQFETVDVRTVEAGDTVDGNEIRIEPAIEIGNIFKLGTRYSVPLGATFLDEDGNSKPVWMGSYGIGPARICAAAVEQFADEKGISWPRSLAPFDIHLVGLGKPGTRGARSSPTRSTRSCARSASTSSTTTATGGPGAKFADAELLGCPLRLTVGGRTLAVRRGRGAGPARPRDAFRPARGGG